MLGVVTGHLGTGKTLFLTYLADWADQHDIPVWANYTLNLDRQDAEQVDVYDLENMSEGLLLIDEAYAWMDSRVSTSKRNRYLSKLIFKSRKRKLDVFVTAQLQSSVDMRMRHLRDIRVHASGPTENDTAFRYIMRGFGKEMEFMLPMWRAEMLFDKYDTFEYPDDDVSEYSPEQLKEEVEQLVEKFKDGYDNPEDLTKGMVEDQLMEWDVHRNIYVEKVYNRIKRLNQIGAL